MLERITGFLSAAVDVVLGLPGALFSYNGVLYSTAAAVVLAVGSLGVTTLTFTFACVAPVLAGVYNYHFNSGFGRF